MTQCIVEDVTRWATQREVLIMGDFNGHLQALDGFQDANGELLMTLAHTLALDVVNLRPDCAGQYTWCARNSCSCIDYALVTSALSLQLTGVNIDESGQFSLGSDHNRIKLTISRSSWRTNPKQRRNPSKRYLPQSAYEAIAEEFEQHFRPAVTPSYEQFVCELRRYMKKHEIRVNSRGGVKRKGWWDKEVQEAFVARRTANRLHRAAAKSSTTEECIRAWEEYLRLKREMRALVQVKIAEHNGKQLKSIIETGGNGAKKFWNYVSSLDRNPPETEIRHESSDQPITDLTEHLTAHIQDLFNPTHGDPAAAVSNDNLEEPDHHSEEDIWQITRLAIERALPRISANTATGLDGIPAGLVKRLGDSAQEHLATIFTTILKNGPIPSDWLCGRFSGTEEDIDVRLPGGGSIPVSDQYRYLGVNFHASAWLERGQRGVGRLALGCHGRVAVEAIQGDLGWSSFEAREARSKAADEGRLRLMNNERWARRVFRYTSLKGVSTQWSRRGQRKEMVDGGANKSTGSRDVDVAIRYGQKSSLALYRVHKTTISVERLYDNSAGSALLFETRAGALRTKVYRRRFDQSVDDSTVQCRACGDDEENIEHIVLRCDRLCPRQPEGTTLPEALGFVEARNDQNTNVRPLSATSITKARLLKWWSGRQ
ncbi:hypothetical protein HPB49_010969 [Dermacentor silvarum]|uniref:Uncharacterized protein n=1 Tax=Dermacentor silvarum TaxID=543639 RepID=A0ACB8DZJ4_DERSI|nr:hypothetical protein HPB49_010969 [Dermacentor silvarum]